MTTTQARLEAIDQELHQIQNSAAARRLLSAGPKVREVWESSSIEWRRRLVALLIEKVVINASDTTGMTKRSFLNVLGVAVWDSHSAGPA